MTDPLASDRVGEPFRFDYDSPVLRYGAGSVADLADELDEQGFERALVVCGSTVGSTPAVMDPIRDGLGDKLAGVFAETTPEKRLSTALDARDAYREHDADVLVALGGGSSLDVAKAVSVLAAGGHDHEAADREFAETGTLAAEGDLEPIVAVPTTLAGAELSVVAGLNAHPDGGPVEEVVSGGLSDRRLMPRAVCYDPELVATTPRDVLAGSAMNGFDKGIETLYAANATPVTDATAARGLGLLVDGLRELGKGGVDADTLEPVLEGLLLVQYGISRPGETTLSVIHAFGHGLTDGYAVQQGVAHAVVAPHVLRHLFAEVDGRRDLLADALGVADADDPAEAVVRTVADVRDALGLPDALADVAGPEPSEFPAVAETVVADSFVANAPRGLDLTTDDVEAVLRAAY
ncbi:probable oxidoreductase (iron-containing alcohol dehydrogenase family) [Halobacterium hubeiense]|jgi:alcohol dehydrogenase|uniref:Iron-containing alcohol dehydrogenase family protein n=2 Tax=Halobacterium TaxID=2239 RepID=A0AAU8CEM2_9EURY|nr:iron-containing alcohol dehydrogenase family protein [Halobacterium hubeiense]CQH61464.1 probable oxidoreductase (iron-containing alcohol dehydrogenase family) [Halobacterium hubeiense]